MLLDNDFFSPFQEYQIKQEKSHKQRCQKTAKSIKPFLMYFRSLGISNNYRGIYNITTQLVFAQ